MYIMKKTIYRYRTETIMLLLLIPIHLTNKIKNQFYFLMMNIRSFLNLINVMRIEDALFDSDRSREKF